MSSPDTYNDDDYDSDYIDEFGDSRDANKDTKIGLLSWKNSKFVASLLIIGLSILVYTLLRYESMIKSASEFVFGPATSSPQDWRKVDIDDLNGKEREEVRTYALAQATFDTITAAIFAISGFFLISILATNDATKNYFGGPVSHFGNLGSFFMRKNSIMTMFVLLCLFAASYALLSTYETMGLYKHPSFLRFWYGSEGEFYTPYDMLGNLVAIASVLTVVWYTFTPENKGSTKKRKLFSFFKNKQNNENEKQFNMVKNWTIAVGFFYLVYAFYGGYIYNTIATSERTIGYLYYLYPLMISVIIAFVAGYFGDGIGASTVAFGICVILIVVRDVGRSASKHWIFNDFNFWNRLFEWTMIISILAGSFMAYNQTLGNFGSRTISSINYSGSQFSSRVYNLSIPTVWLGIFMGGFLFFCLQLFWSTTLLLGDLSISVVSALVFSLTWQEVGGYGRDLQLALYSGFSVTGVFWFMMIQQETFRKLVTLSD